MTDEANATVQGCWGSKVMGVKAGAGVVRCFRTVRIVLLVKRMPGLMTLVDTLVSCLRPSMNIAVISSLFFYIYAIVGMKLFEKTLDNVTPDAVIASGGLVEVVGANELTDNRNSFLTFTSSLKLLFQLINGQTLFAITYELRDFGVIFPFVYIASFYFVLVFICMNLLVCCVLDNFSVLASMDDDHFNPDDLDKFANVWHQLTFGRIHDVDPQLIGIDINERMSEAMTDDELQTLFDEKKRREDKHRLRQWTHFKKEFAPAPYFPLALFSGWLHRPNALSMKIKSAASSSKNSRYFWLDADCNDPDSEGHLCINWFADGSTERDLDGRHANGRLVASRARVVAVHTPLPDAVVETKATVLDTHGRTKTLDDGRVNKLAAAVSGRAWLVAIATAQQDHPENVMARCFDLDYYETVLGNDDTLTLEDAMHGHEVSDLTIGSVHVGIAEDGDVEVIHCLLDLVGPPVSEIVRLCALWLCLRIVVRSTSVLKTRWRARMPRLCRFASTSASRRASCCRRMTSAASPASRTTTRCSGRSSRGC
jgi:hypothetical protein